MKSKSNAAVAKSPTKRVTTQISHLSYVNDCCI